MEARVESYQDDGNYGQKQAQNSTPHPPSLFRIQGFNDINWDILNEMQRDSTKYNEILPNATRFNEILRNATR
jgi:hypothetical protein